MNEVFTADNDAERNFLDCAVEIAQSIDNLEGRSEIISLIAFKHAEAGQLDVAVDLAETINDSYLRDQALAGIAAKSVEVGAADYADQISDMIQDDAAYALATEQVAVAYAQSGAFEKSLEVAHRLAESAPTLRGIAIACAGSGLPVQALEAARSIDYPELKAPVLVELAAKALQDARNPEAVELLLDAIGAAEEVEFLDQRISTLVAIASLYGKCGQEEQAFEILTGAHDLCKDSEDIAQDAPLAQIAGGFAELQRYDQADQAIEEIEDAFQFAHATAGVAMEYHKAGDTDKALGLLAEAMEIVRDEEVYGEQGLLMRESVLNELAVCYAMVGHYEEALQITELMNSQDQQHRTLGAIAKLCVRSGNNNRALQATEMIKDNYARVLCDLEIVDAFMAAEQLELADHALSQARARTATLERPDQRTVALMGIAPRLARRDQGGPAAEVLFEALTTLAKIDDSYRQSHALIDLAGKYQELGQQAGKREQAVLEEMTLKLER